MALTLVTDNTSKILKFKLATEVERKAIRLKFTVALIENILNDRC